MARLSMSSTRGGAELPPVAAKRRIDHREEPPHRPEAGGPNKANVWDRDARLFIDTPLESSNKPKVWDRETQDYFDERNGWSSDAMPERLMERPTQVP